MAKKLVVLDPGHGGKDPGAVGNSLLEKEITLMLARRVAKRLGFYDVAVKLTRDDDTYLSLEARAQIANNLKADYFLSIHVNAGGGTGFESYIYNGPVSTLSVSYRSIIHSRIATFLKNYGVTDRGEKTANFQVLRQTTMPAALIENLFIDSAKDAALLKDEEFVKGLCDSITAGIVQALKLSPLPAEPAPGPQPTASPSPTWDPQQEVEKLKQAGLLANDHPASAAVTWGELATVLNRLLKLIPKN
ncbi:N-acetylmuramoyl-L-alanine amidase family protein [Desulforamulus hydrothermalis]|uniref:Cell wall hydrolase/autolysin n=1 Tax=Desulforamulus hydrothermalis Lam5 = DSM 18033 TaxID=1121428 RepID=K8E0X1_9FIRM|nr:N-acetylmuramoyl-L-alanine amidase [Desulforamulus hydrothermalis]CCO09302.1 Cell wall hydrolase/autolysin [Desulforamulus hydrothermalis Lam5 = DSM 18033]SHH04576.1 N-acetylmuramoyl-L-alanine amidase [Desulforamulus hydrothermalis Lam5 = DSM 18033]